MDTFTFNRPQNVPMYTPTEDVDAQTEDGRTIQVAVKGVPMPLHQAQALGIVKPPKADKAPEPEPVEPEKEAEPEKAKILPGPTANKPHFGPAEKK